jgi:hypothetical protein
LSLEELQQRARQPEKIYHVSQTHLSVARFYGGCKVFGATYVYNPVDDTLTREDVFKKEQKAKTCNSSKGPR